MLCFYFRRNSEFKFFQGTLRNQNRRGNGDGSGRALDLVPTTPPRQAARYHQIGVTNVMLHQTPAENYHTGIDRLIRLLYYLCTVNLSKKVFGNLSFRPILCKSVVLLKIRRNISIIWSNLDHIHISNIKDGRTAAHRRRYFCGRSRRGAALGRRAGPAATAARRPGRGRAVGWRFGRSASLGRHPATDAVGLERRGRRLSLSVKKFVPTYIRKEC